MMDVDRLRQAFIRAGIVWVLPAKLFEGCVVCVAREYDALTPKVDPEGNLTITVDANGFIASIEKAETPHA